MLWTILEKVFIPIQWDTTFTTPRWISLERLSPLSSNNNSVPAPKNLAQHLNKAFLGRFRHCCQVTEPSETRWLGQSNFGVQYPYYINCCWTHLTRGAVWANRLVIKPCLITLIKLIFLHQDIHEIKANNGWVLRAMNNLFAGSPIPRAFPGLVVSKFPF